MPVLIAFINLQAQQLLLCTWRERGKKTLPVLCSTETTQIWRCQMSAFDTIFLPLWSNSKEGGQIVWVPDCLSLHMLHRYLIYSQLAFLQQPVTPLSQRRTKNQRNLSIMFDHGRLSPGQIKHPKTSLLEVFESTHNSSNWLGLRQVLIQSLFCTGKMAGGKDGTHKQP